ncbi:type II toxin-antitoxin system RelE/ParE family toxin [Candidatus Woesearchaeota archaeon]|nr:type II toxin-antitoxin system RelE/ParE family toxin [Candidatus Woesearchaeota archaeon]HIH37735.1 type II toxin-antitoxin system RelE/ParE family toxin [Candidatus Woesearchaeota archaeon]HIH48954.1 type II toxin-antitoxin system RelE/ParE family toxin [Candidatus Woesearchaeota archaeon]HIJ02687.1 type II toxin-antitoxin system RelE/ParE family toxin [Candidatus Woesearchaeota archaeon]
MYSLIYSELAAKQLKKLNKETQLRILNTLERCRIRPLAYVKRLVGCAYYRLRVGDYRVIMDIKEDTLIIFVFELGHRKNIYK